MWRWWVIILFRELIYFISFLGFLIGLVVEINFGVKFRIFRFNNKFFNKCLLFGYLFVNNLIL